MNAIVYRLYDEHHALLYVGVTNNVDRRMAEHSVDKVWWMEVADIEFDCYGDREEAELEERIVIWQERPRYNIRRDIEQTHIPRPGRRAGEMVALADVAFKIENEARA